MSKRTRTKSAINNPRNYWPTPIGPINQLGRILPAGMMYDEPCAGDGRLIRGLAPHGLFCVQAHDLVPQGAGIRIGNALNLPISGRPIITNPPYAKSLLEPLLDHWIGRTEVWLLLPSDMMVNKWTNPYMRFVDRILPIGRVSWMENGKAGFENSVWFRFSTDRVDLILNRD